MEVCYNFVIFGKGW